MVADESRVLWQWRYDQLVRAGYDSATALKLAESEADLHEAVELHEQGCPDALALKILL